MKHSHPKQSPFVWQLPDQQLSLGDSLPLLMGIVNVTPDSFSDGGKFLSPQKAIDHALQLAAEGADILDVGGESTRPYAEPVSLSEELQRVIPVIEKLSKETALPISIDTTKAEVAKQAMAAGACIVNDISGLLFDANMPKVCAKSKAAVIVMHTAGKPQTMQDDPQYKNVVKELSDYFEERLTTLTKQGISSEQIVLDPGIGFGKTAEHNLEILSHVSSFRDIGRPVLIGHSRKRFLKKIIGRDVEERFAGTLGVAIAVASQGADILRIHDVQAIKDGLTAWQTIMQST